MKVYSNGNLPGSALALIPGTNQYIAVDLLPQVNALRAAFRAHFGKNLRVTDGYRSLAGQVAARNRYLAGKGAYAVPPGTSNHGLGRAIDFGSNVNVLNSPEHKWMVANAPRFGFVWLKRAGNGSIEPWHFDGSVIPASNYQTPTPSKTVNPPALSVPVAPKRIEDDDMKDILIALYLKNMGRLPDPAGASAYISAVATGTKTWAQVDTELQGSPESKAFAALGSEETRNRQRAAAAGNWVVGF